MKKSRSVAAMKALAMKLSYEMLHQEQELVEWDVCGYSEVTEVYEGVYRTKALWTMIQQLEAEIAKQQFLTDFEINCYMDICATVALAAEAYRRYTERVQQMDLRIIVIV